MDSVHLHISFPGTCEQDYEVESADMNVFHFVGGASVFLDL